MSREMLRSPQFWLGILGTVGSFIAIWLFIDLGEVWRALISANPLDLFVVGIGVILFLVMRAFRWRLLLQHQIGWRPIFHIQNIGYMLSMLLPFRLGDIARAVLVGNIKPVTFWQGMSTMVIERLLDLLLFVALLPFAISGLQGLPPDLQNFARISGYVAIGGLVLMLFLAVQRPLVERILDQLPFLNRLRPTIGRILDGFAALGTWRDAFMLIVWTVLVWVPVYIAYFFALRAVGLTIPPIELLFVLCAAAFGVAIPSSPGQLGVFHGAVLFALVFVLGYPDGPSGSFALLYHAIQYVLFILMGVWGMVATGQTWSAVVTNARGWADRSEPAATD